MLLFEVRQPTQESCLMGRPRAGLLQGDGELMDVDRNGRRGFLSTPADAHAFGPPEDADAGVGKGHDLD